MRVREREFDALCATSASSTSENIRLKSELQRLEALNEAERCELENKLNTVIHGHSSELRNRTEQFGRLQTRLQERILTYRRTCAEQEEEINRLRDERVLLEQQVSTVGATRMEVIEMQTVMDGWQAQAIALQRELEIISEAAGHAPKTLPLRHTQLSLLTIIPSLTLNLSPKTRTKSCIYVLANFH